MVGDSGTGVLDKDLRTAALAALDIPRDLCRAHALTFSWEASARQFLDNIRRVQSPLNAVVTGIAA